MIEITPRISIKESDLHEDFIRSSGAGGQNVNKVSTAVQLRFDARGSTDLPDAVKTKLFVLAGRRANNRGEIVVTARRHRTQERNRADALERLVELIREATKRDAFRVPTRPTLGSKLRRLEGKKKTALVKRQRSTTADD